MKESKEVDDDVQHDVHAKVMELYHQVKEFMLVNHLYWELWTINQATEEGCKEFDYITYATKRSLYEKGMEFNVVRCILNECCASNVFGCCVQWTE